MIMGQLLCHDVETAGIGPRREHARAPGLTVATTTTTAAERTANGIEKKQD